MKQKIFYASLLLALTIPFAGCNQGEENSPEEQQQQQNEKTKKFTFTVKGDFSSEWKPVTKKVAASNEYLSADGKEMTDLWVLDYMGDELIQQIHQTPEDEDWGVPVMQLKYGSHHIYFITARGSDPVLNTTAKTITFGIVRDTFYKDYAVTVVSTSNGNRAVTLDRAVTKLRLEFTDPVPDNAGSINITPGTWYYGMNYATGEPTAAANNQIFTINIPESTYGMTGMGANMFGFSTADEWTTDIAFNAKNTTGDLIGSATIEDAPFKRNRITCYSGPLFGSSGGMTLSLNSDWDTSVTGTW